MGINKVQINKDNEIKVLIDLTLDTVTEDTLLEGITAHRADGEQIVGTFTSKLQNKTVTPTTNVQNVTPDSGYDGLGKVTVNAMPTATQATPSINVYANGKIVASATQSAGYVESGTKSATVQLTTQAAKTITPSTSSQTAVAKNVYTTGVVTVAAIPSTYIQPSGTKTITTNGTHDVKSYASATVNVAGEDVTTETNTYTNELTDLVTQISALETALEGKAAGGSSGGGNITFGILNVEDMGMYEPGVNKYILSSDDLKPSTRQCIILLEYHGDSTHNLVLLVCSREKITDSFSIFKGASHDFAEHAFGVRGIIFDENSITVCGNVADSNSLLRFIAF